MRVREREEREGESSSLCAAALVYVDDDCFLRYCPAN